MQNLTAQYNPANHIVIATQTAAYSPPTVLQKYHFPATRLEVNVSLTNEPDGADSLLTKMKKYGDNVKQSVFNETSLPFWRSRETVYPKLVPVALDLISAPASQAFVERIFSVCGLLSSGLKNRTTTSIEQRVFLEINKKSLLDGSTPITLNPCCPDASVKETYTIYREDPIRLYAKNVVTVVEKF